MRPGSLARGGAGGFAHQETLADEREAEDEAEGDAPGVVRGAELLEEVQEGVVVDEDVLLGVRLGHDAAPEAEEARRASPLVPRRGGEIHALQVIGFFALDQGGDEVLADLEAPSRGGADTRALADGVIL